MLSLMCIAREFFFGWLHVISTGSISTVQTEGQGSCILPEQNENLFLQALTCALLDTDRSHKTALTADEKRYLAVYIH
ncbi:unnamed protein product [Staurois parvus]|uniref:Secreted protein n=1 Tax=Staurois parvus TaxID=386267 RepID=A0ABN9BA38_9NEOB|nr:unnamed protein product [Staurois parvus]